MTLKLEGKRAARSSIQISAVIGNSCPASGDFLHDFISWHCATPGIAIPPSGKRLGTPGQSCRPACFVRMDRHGVMFIIFGYGCYKAFLPYGKRAKTAGWMLAMYGLVKESAPA